MLGARHNFAIPLDRDPAIAESKLADEPSDGRTVYDDAGFSVDHDLDGLRHRGGNYHASSMTQAVLDVMTTTSVPWSPTKL